MSPRNRQRLGIAIVVFIFALSGGYYYRYVYVPPRPVLSSQTGETLEAPPGQYYTVKDSTGTVIFTTGHAVNVGDEFITPADLRYQVTGVDGLNAVASNLGKMEALLEIPIIGAETKTYGNTKVSIYHTHSDESYIPSDGSDSIPAKGGIFQVGKQFAASIMEKGAQAIQSLTSHDPHDAAAYDRSRRTLVQMLKEQPAAVFDVHRDAGPSEPYLEDLPGEGTVSKGMIVVGRTNPKYQTNLEFARRLMNAVNAKYPELIKGIFMGKSDFNQDLHDRALLLEMGTEQVSKEDAEKGVALIGSIVPSVLGVGSTTPTGPSGRTSGTSIGWILGLSVAGTFIYLWISTGSWDEMRAKIMGWFGSAGARVGGGKRGGGPEGS